MLLIRRFTALNLRSSTVRTLSTTSTFPRLFTKDHEWVQRTNSTTVKIGITDFAQKALGDIVYLETPDMDKIYKQSGTFEEFLLLIVETMGAVESVKAASDIYAPVSGRIVRVNDVLEADPSLAVSKG
jgi:glycine cleavage system H protein